MKYIKKYCESLKIYYSDEDIEEIFYDLIDQGAELNITDNYLTENNKVIRITPYIKTPKTTRHCKLVELTIKSDSKGIDISILGMGLTTIKNIDILDDITSRIKKFYSMLDQQEPNFTINSDYRGLNIIFVVIGNFLSLSNESSKSELVDKHLLNLEKALKINKNYRIKINGNWLEMGGKDCFAKSTYLYNIKRGTYNADHHLYDQSKSIKSLVDWYNKLIEDGLDFKQSGGDNQMVIQLI